VKLESLIQYVDGYLDVSGFPDYGDAHNGLQVEGPGEAGTLAVAVDASQRVISVAAERGADLLIVHHGLFWDSKVLFTGRRYRKIRTLIHAELALYSVHLPLDAHPEVGNSAVLCRALGWEPSGGFGTYQERTIGCWAEVDMEVEALRDHVGTVVEGPVRLIQGGPERVHRVGIVTGGGAGMMEEAVAGGLDTLITGEGAHHTYHDAMELGLNVLYAGHYATEVWGVKALAAHLEERFALPWTFIDDPSGL
jgi:dinuclear metal center YbgI/SA1388 family protein